MHKAKKPRPIEALILIDAIIHPSPEMAAAGIHQTWTHRETTVARLLDIAPPRASLVLIEVDKEPNTDGRPVVHFVAVEGEQCEATLLAALRAALDHRGLPRPATPTSNALLDLWHSRATPCAHPTKSRFRIEEMHQWCCACGALLEDGAWLRPSLKGVFA